MIIRHFKESLSKEELMDFTIHKILTIISIIVNRQQVNRLKRANRAPRLNHLIPTQGPLRKSLRIQPKI